MSRPGGFDEMEADRAAIRFARSFPPAAGRGRLAVMTGFRIRPFALADEQAVIDLIVPIQREEFGVEITAADQPDLRDVSGYYLPGAGAFLVAEADGRIVGTIALKDIGNGQAALRKMFVAADWRGREHGVAAALLQCLLDHARRARLREVMLGTTDKFQAAHRFYEKNGFRLVARADLPPAFPFMKPDTRFYRIALDG